MFKTKGKKTLSGRIVVSADGESRTVTTSRTDTRGKGQDQCSIRQTVIKPPL